MSESNPELAKIVSYMKSHWPSRVKSEWQVDLSEYPKIAQRVLADFTAGKTTNHYLFRIAGLSGSGKTTQILPAVEAYCQKNNLDPVLVAARRFVEYHPYYQEIRDYYGEENLRQNTDEFATILLFLVLSKLSELGYDIILDVTLLDPQMEAILLHLLNVNHYQAILLMIAVSPKVTEHFLGSRAWRHTKATEQEFIRATSEALKFYASNAPELHIILWSVYDKDPIYDGPVKDCLEIFTDYSNRENLPAPDDDVRRAAKIEYLMDRSF